MVIFDDSLNFLCSAPGAGLPFATSSTHLITDGTNGVAPIISDGEPVSFEVEVTTAFVASGQPAVQIGMLVSSNASLSSDVVALGFTPMSVVALTNTSLRIVSGLIANDLYLGAKFIVTLQPWSRDVHALGVDILPQTQSLYLGLAMFNPAYDMTGSPYFTSGAVRARCLQTGAQRSHQDRVYPSRMRVK